jgi:hypothetical protein
MFDAPSAGVLALRLRSTGRHAVLLAGGRVVFAAAGKRSVVLKLSHNWSRALRRARHLRVVLNATFTPRGGAPGSATLTVTMSR